MRREVSRIRGSKRRRDELGVEEKGLPALGEGVNELESVLVYERNDQFLSERRETEKNARF